MAHNEDTLVQQPTAEYLHQVLHWDESINAMKEVLGKEGTLGRTSEREVILTRYLGERLMALNPHLPMEAYQDALRIVTETSSSSTLLATNQEKDHLHKNGVEVSFRNDKGERIKKRLRLFDFDNPENNHFLVVREFWIASDFRRRRADIVGFVNGIPLVFMELKTIYKDIRAAYEKNFLDYKDTVPHLFHHNAFVIIANGLDAKIGSISSRFEHFHEWKRLQENEVGVVDMQTLLKGTCSKQNLLDMVENFIVFDDSSGDLVKIVARNHQYLGVNQALESVKKRQALQGKLGVFWHTQGSGKSYSIVFFARKVHRKLGGNFSFVVVTDREDLDTQIYKTFAGCGVVDHDKDPCRASSGEHLQTLLQQQKAYVFSLIQKFNQNVKQAYTTRDDVIVITDEAHRTQYGLLSLNMRNALPNAGFMGFTGTPLFSDDEVTKKVFGKYVSTYDFKRAVDDKATVPLYYDARGEKLLFKGEDGKDYPVADPKGLNEKIAATLEELEIDNVDVEKRLERALKRDYHILTASKRLGQIAEDFVEHYSNGWETGKAMLVCLDKMTCVRMYNLIDFHWQAKIKQLEKQLKQYTDEQELIFRQRQLVWMRETQRAVVISEEQNEIAKFAAWDLEIDPHRRLIREGFTQADGKRLDIETAFKRSEHPFRVAIVCAMWLTGFDVPSLATLYLDKPLKAHTLMQAIARANRVAEGKTNGLIIDYCGILKNLREALGTFASAKDDGRSSSDPQPIDPTTPQVELLDKLQQAITMVQDYFTEQAFELSAFYQAQGFDRNKVIAQAKEAVNHNDLTRKRFEVLAREVIKQFKACINVKGVNAYRGAHDAIALIYRVVRGDQQAPDISVFLRELQKVVDDSIDTTSHSIKDHSTLYDISQIDFERLRQEFARIPNPCTTVQNLKGAIEQRLNQMLAQNPLRTNFQEHYEALVADYNKEKDHATIEQTFAALLKFVESLNQEEKRAVREGLDEENLAVFDLLLKAELTIAERNKLKSVAINLLQTLKAGRLKVEHWCEKESTRDAVKQYIYDFLYDEKTGLPTDFYSEEEVELYSDKVFWHVHRAYPLLPSPYYN